MATDVFQKNLTGVLQTVRPKMESDGTTQHSWVSGQSNSKFYTFIAVLKDDGGRIYEGEVSANKPFNYSIPQGSTITCELYENEACHNKTKFKKMKAVQKPDMPNKSSYNDPENNLQMAFSMSRTHAINTYLKLLKKVDDDAKFWALVDLYYNWITMDHTINDRNKLSRRWYALQDAVEAIDVFGYNTTSKIIEYADSFIQHEQGTSAGQ